MSKYPNYETYRKLYKKFYDNRSSEELLELAGSMRGKRVLDLCGGDGRLSMAAMECGAKIVWLVDQELSMIAAAIDWQPQIKMCVGSVTLWLKKADQQGEYFDYVFCQQAVNYWLVNEKMVKMLAKVLVKDGVFVFNTFNRKPTKKPMIKEYELDGVSFAEVSWLVGSWVHHVQIREGIPCHVTRFRWLSPDYLISLLEPLFSVTIKIEGNTSLYYCLKK